MYIGHFAPAFAAAAISPRAPKLATLFVAAQLVDWAFFILVTVGIEAFRITPGITVMSAMDLYHMPYTHSLLGSAVWAVIFGLIITAAYRDFAAGVLAAFVVISHWILDFLVHAPDLTIAGTPPKLGLGLWNYPWIEMPLEILITVSSLAWYMRRTKGPVGPPFILITILLLFQTIDWFGPHPQTAGLQLQLIALSSFAIATALAWWVDDTRWHKREVGLAVPTMRR